MSGRYGRHIAALGGLTVLFFCGDALAQKPHSPPHAQEAQGNQRQPIIPSPLPVAPNEPKSREYHPPCEHPSNASESELCAQWEAADAAYEATHLAKYQAGLGILGFIGLLATLVYTARSTRAAIRGNQISHAAMIVNQRAYVFSTDLRSEWERDSQSGLYGWRVRPIWANSGSSPTKQLRLMTTYEIRTGLLPTTVDLEGAASEIGSGLIAPQHKMWGGCVPKPGTPPLYPQDLIDIQTGAKNFFMWGWVRYFDVFPDTPERITRFCWAITIVGDPYKFAPDVEGSAPLFGMIHVPFGNCADDECS